MCSDSSKRCQNVTTKGRSIIHLGSFYSLLWISDNLDHLDLAISKESKRTESTFCAVSGKTFETIITASVPKKFIALSAVNMNID